MPMPDRAAAATAAAVVPSLPSFAQAFSGFSSSHHRGIHTHTHTRGQGQSQADSDMDDDLDDDDGRELGLGLGHGHGRPQHTQQQQQQRRRALPPLRIRTRSPLPPPPSMAQQHPHSQAHRPRSETAAARLGAGPHHLHPHPSHAHAHHAHVPAKGLRKRPRPPGRDDGYESSDSSTPGVKQEQDVDQLDPSPSPPLPAKLVRSKSNNSTASAHSAAWAPPPPPVHAYGSSSTNANNTNNTNNNSINGNGNGAAHAPTPAQPPSVSHSYSHARSTPLPPPPPTSSSSSSYHHPPKRRRVTISGGGQPYALVDVSPSGLGHAHAHTPPPGSSAAYSRPGTGTGTAPGTGAPSTPISPVVMGFTIQRDDPTAFEQVRAMLAVKQKQKALIEQRRGSVAGLDVAVAVHVSGAGGAGAGAIQRRGSVAGLQHESRSRRGSMSVAAATAAAAGSSGVLTPTPSVNIVNPTPTSATAPPPAPGPNSRRGPSPNGANSAAPLSLSPNTRMAVLGGNGSGSGGGGARTRSPSVLGGARTPPRHPHAQGRHQPQQAPQATMTTALSGRSPPRSSATQSLRERDAQRDGQQRERESQQAARGGHVQSPPQQVRGASPNTSRNYASASTAPAGADSPTPGIATSAAITNASGDRDRSAAALVASQGLAALAHNLPPPPTSFARRRAGRGNKPADLMISPREIELDDGAGGDRSLKSAKGESLVQNQSQGQQPQSQAKDTMMPAPPPRIPAISATYKALLPAVQSAPPRPGIAPGRFPPVEGGGVRSNLSGAPMALPSLPPVIAQSRVGAVSSATGSGTATGVGTVKRGQVPPTPTRLLSMQRAQQAGGAGGGEGTTNVRLSQPTGAFPRVPKTATGATFGLGASLRPGAGAPSISGATAFGASGLGAGVGGSGSGGAGIGAGSSGMPATPATLHRVGTARTGAEKAAFLAPFEQFYDALGDAQVLKGWFGEQLRRVGALARDAEQALARVREVEAQREREREKGKERDASSGNALLARTEIERIVADALRAEAGGWRDEVARLRARVAELEDALYARGPSASGEVPTTNGLPTPMPTAGSLLRASGSPPERSDSITGPRPGSSPREMYTFPPPGAPPPTLAAPVLSVHSQRGTGGGGGGFTLVPVADRETFTRSATASPARTPQPEYGISRRLSVSAMRYEPGPARARTPPPPAAVASVAPVNGDGNGNGSGVANAGESSPKRERERERRGGAKRAGEDAEREISGKRRVRASTAKESSTPSKDGDRKATEDVGTMNIDDEDASE